MEISLSTSVKCRIRMVFDRLSPHVNEYICMCYFLFEHFKVINEFGGGNQLIFGGGY